MCNQRVQFECQQAAVYACGIMEVAPLRGDHVGCHRGFGCADTCSVSDYRVLVIGIPSQIMSPLPEGSSMRYLQSAHKQSKLRFSIEVRHRQIVASAG